MELEATELRNGQWAVRPAGQLGTMGWHPYPWTVVYVRAPNAGEAVRKAARTAKMVPAIPVATARDDVAAQINDSNVAAQIMEGIQAKGRGPD